MISFHQIVEDLKLLKHDSELYRRMTSSMKFRNGQCVFIKKNECLQKYIAFVVDTDMGIWVECEYLNSYPLNYDLSDLMILIRKSDYTTEYVEFNNLHLHVPYHQDEFQKKKNRQNYFPRIQFQMTE
jgi:hypothetical protein